MRGATNAHGVFLPTIFCYGASGTIQQSTDHADTVTLSYSKDNDPNGEFYSFSNSKVTIKKSGMYLVEFSLLGIFNTATRAQVSYSKNTNTEYSYQIGYVQALPGTQGLNGTHVAEFTTGDIIGLTGWVAAGSCSVSSNVEATHLRLTYLGVGGGA